jgi:hypothetical protein
LKAAVVILFTLLLCACVSYDMPVIYHKNFSPGVNDKIRFDGCYVQTLQGKNVKPVFLYRDGSACVAETPVDSNLVSVPDAALYSWGNYKVNSDTILVERFYKEEAGSNFNRIIMRGVIGKDRIDWNLRTFHRDHPDTVNYSSRFIRTNTKPDSTKNWTRTKELYNK